MMDTDDLDRALRTAVIAVGERDAAPTDPAPRVARRVARRRRRRIAARVGTVIVATAIAAATIGGLFSASRSKPAHLGPPPTAPAPSVLLTPQTPADREGIAAFRRVDGAVPSSVRLLATSLGVRLYGAIDRAGLPCVMIVIGDHGGTSAASGCLLHRPKPVQLRADIARFERQGTNSVVSESEKENPRRMSAAGFFVPDGVRTLVIDARHYVVTRDSVLLATNVGMVEREVRSGSTLYVVTK